MKKTFLTTAFLLFISLLCLSNSTPNKNGSCQDNNNNDIEGKLIITGSSSMQELCDDLANSFMEIYPKVEVVKSGLGSAEAAGAVQHNICQIGDISRELTIDEQPENFNKKILAFDGIAICINNDNPIENISLKQLQEIFSGKITNWASLGGTNSEIVTIGRDSASGSRSIFEKTAELKDKCRYSLIQDSNGKVKYKIINDKNAIGYISFAVVDKNLKALRIDNIAPTFENIKNHNYKFKHPLMQITKKDSFDEIVNIWFEFVYSHKGIKIIEANKLLATTPAAK